MFSVALVDSDDGNSSSSGRLEAFVVDLNGIPRGKWLVGAAARRTIQSGMNLPPSLVATDIFGDDVAAAGLVFETGDPDGIARPVSGVAPMPWADADDRQLQLSCYDGSGQAFFADPRHVLAGVARDLEARGLTAVIGVELEFFLFDSQRALQAPHHPATGLALGASPIMSVAGLDETRAFVDAQLSACGDLGIPIEGVLCESGVAQLEFDLEPIPDPLAAADAVIQFRRAAHGLARRIGWHASFMAKPISDASGSGMHVHVSLLDSAGRNLFAGAAGRTALHHAIGGCLSHVGDSLLVFAPHANSYRRFASRSHAPTQPDWGDDNRIAALRVPRAVDAATRFEHRAPGADSNPYLVLATILRAAIDGIDREIDPGQPSLGESPGADGPFARLPVTWHEAIERFGESPWIEKQLGGAFQRVFHSCKLQEFQRFARRVTDFERETYLRVL